MGIKAPFYDPDIVIVPMLRHRSLRAHVIVVVDYALMFHQFDVSSAAREDYEAFIDLMTSKWPCASRRSILSCLYPGVSFTLS